MQRHTMCKCIPFVNALAFANLSPSKSDIHGLDSVGAVDSNRVIGIHGIRYPYRFTKDVCVRTTSYSLTSCCWCVVTSFVRIE